LNDFAPKNMPLTVEAFVQVVVVVVSRGKEDA